MTEEKNSKSHFSVTSMKKKPHTLNPTKAISHGKYQFSFRKIKHEGIKYKKEGKKMPKKEERKSLGGIKELCFNDIVK